MLRAVTHNGPFHADDVLAYALVRAFADEAATITRTRDASTIAGGDLVFDVGGVYDPARLRFDHHQASYQGPLSSAGMVLQWLVDTDKIDADTFESLKVQVVDFVDDVDNGRRPPKRDVPCFGKFVDACNRGCDTFEEFDAAYLRAVDSALLLVRGIAAGVVEDRHARAVMRAAMDAASGRVLRVGECIRWKPAYFAEGGASHPSDTLLMPSPDGTWHVYAVPPAECSFAQKAPLPSEWAGLTGDALIAVVGVPGARFAHKNLFIAVFDTESAAVDALQAWNRWP